jgi:hypothetical protein
VVRHAWLLIGGLFGLGAVTGVLYARSIAARKKRLRQAMVGLLGLYYGVLAPSSTVSAHHGSTNGAAQTVPGHQVIRGDDGWELEINTSPEPPTVGSLVHLDLWLRKDGVVFPGMTAVSIAGTNLEAGQTVLETHILAHQGQTT